MELPDTGFDAKTAKRIKKDLVTAASSGTSGSGAAYSTKQPCKRI